MRFRGLGHRGWLLAVEVVLLGVGIVAALLSLSAARKLQHIRPMPS